MKSRLEGPFRGRVHKEVHNSGLKGGHREGEQVEGTQPRSLEAMENRAVWGGQGRELLVGRGMQATQNTELTCCFHCTSCVTRPLEEQSTQIIYKKVPTCSWAWLQPHLG